MGTQSTSLSDSENARFLSQINKNNNQNVQTEKIQMSLKMTEFETCKLWFLVFPPPHLYIHDQVRNLMVQSKVQDLSVNIVTIVQCNHT